MHEEKKFSLSLILYVSGMSKSTYYYLLNKKDLDSKNADIMAKIIDVFYDNNQNYGVRRVYHHLKNEGYKINHKKVQRLMKKLGLSAKKHKQKYHSYQGTVGPVAKNLVNRNFKANKPNEKWTTDVSQFNFSRGKCYLSPTMDMYNNEIIGYDLSLNPNFNQIERMLDSIVFTGRNISNLVFHSDQGRQYQNPRFVAFLKNKNIMQSMSRKGNCFDNSIMESFFGIMKNEIYYGKENSIINFNHFKFLVDEYMRYYNNKRIKKKTGWLSPVQYRLKNGYNW